MINKQVQASSANATVLVVAGGAGSENTYSAAIIHVRRDQMMLDAFRQDGTPLPQGFSKTKP